MKIIRGIGGGIAFGIISMIFGWLVYGGLFATWTQQASHLWRPMESLYWRLGMPLADIFGGLIISLAYAILHKGVPGEGLRKGLIFGLIIWLITRVAGELYYYVMSPIPFMLVVAGWVHGLLVSVSGGIALAAIYGKSLEQS